MSPPLRFGIVVEYQCMNVDVGQRLDELVEVVETARDLGFDSAFGIHHYLAQPPTPQPIPVLARLIPHSGSMQLGTGVYLATVEHPVRLAENVATLDQLSGGRVVLGLGAGYRPEEFAAFGVDRARRWSRLAETVSLLRALWTGETVIHHGEHFHLDGHAVSLTPRQPGGPPILIGANGPTTVARAAAIGDSWIAPPNVKPRWAIGNLATFIGALERNGLSPGGRDFVIQRELYVAESDAAARDEVAPYLRAEYELLSRYGLDYFETMFDDLFAKAFLVGSPETVASRIAELGDGGFTHIVFRTSWGGLPMERSLRSLRLFAEAVMPQFAARPQATGAAGALASRIQE